MNICSKILFRFLLFSLAFSPAVPAAALSVRTGFGTTPSGNTALTGAVIASQAPAEKNSLVTGTLTVADLQNQAEYAADSWGFQGGLSSGNNLGRGEDPSGPDFSLDKARYTIGLNPSFPMEDGASTSSLTRSAVAPGSVTITDPEGQAVVSGQAAEVFLALLNRDTEGAHAGPLEANPDLKQVLADQKKRADLTKDIVRYLNDGLDYANKWVFNKEYAETLGKKEAAEATIKNQKSSPEDRAEAEAVMALLNDPQKKADYEKWMPGGSYRLALQVVGTVAAVEYNGGQTMEAILGMAAGYLAYNSPTVQEFAAHMSQQLAGSDTNAQNHYYDQFMNLFAMTGALTGGLSGQAGYQQAKPAQMLVKALNDERAEKKENNKAVAESAQLSTPLK